MGDPHVTPEEIGDCQKLLRYIIDVARNSAVDDITILGDQHHTHAVLRLEVVGFWLHAFNTLERELPGIEVVCVVGNHDVPGDAGLALNAMMCYGGSRITVVDRPMVRSGVLHMPYYHDREAFIRDCNRHPSEALVCHQTFDGSRYENGFPASDGVDPDHVPQSEILSGHLHTQQEVAGGKVWYPGSPRWRVANDANVPKAIWVVDREGPRIVRKQPFDTSGACRAIFHVKFTPDDPFRGDLGDPRHDYRVDVEGPAAWVDEQVAKLPPWAKVRPIRLLEKAPRVRESDGIEASFRRFAEGFDAPGRTPPAELLRLARERLGV